MIPAVLCPQSPCWAGFGCIWWLGGGEKDMRKTLEFVGLPDLGFGFIVEVSPEKEEEEAFLFLLRRIDFPLTLPHTRLQHPPPPSKKSNFTHLLCLLC